MTREDIIDAAVRAGAAEWYGENWRMSLIRFMAASNHNPASIVFAFVRKSYLNLAGAVPPMRVSITRSHPPCAGKAQDIYAALERFNAAGAAISITALMEASGAYRALLGSTLANWQRDGTLRVALVPADYERGSAEVVADLQALADRFAAPRSAPGNDDAPAACDEKTPETPAPLSTRDLPKPAQANGGIRTRPPGKASPPAVSEPVGRVAEPAAVYRPPQGPAAPPPPATPEQQRAANKQQAAHVPIKAPGGTLVWDWSKVENGGNATDRVEIVLTWHARKGLPMPSNTDLVRMASLGNYNHAQATLHRLDFDGRVRIEWSDPIGKAGRRRVAIPSSGATTEWSANGPAHPREAAPKLRPKLVLEEPRQVKPAAAPADEDIGLDDDTPPARMFSNDAELERLMAGRRYGKGRVRE